MPLPPSCSGSGCLVLWSRIVKWCNQRESITPLEVSMGLWNLLHSSQTPRGRILKGSWGLEHTWISGPLEVSGQRPVATWSSHSLSMTDCAVALCIPASLPLSPDQAATYSSVPIYTPCVTLVPDTCFTTPLLMLRTKLIISGHQSSFELWPPAHWPRGCVIQEAFLSVWPAPGNNMN